MEIVTVSNCAEAFGYGKIDEKIKAECYMFEEGEALDYRGLQKIVQNDNNDFITVCSMMPFRYPISLKMDLLGMWGYYGKEFSFVCEMKEEQKLDMNQGCLHYGVCKISKIYFPQVVKMLNRVSLVTCLVIGNGLDKIKMEFFKMNNKNYFLDFETIINYCCREGKSVITCIEGYDGTSFVRFFT